MTPLDRFSPSIFDLLLAATHSISSPSPRRLLPPSIGLLLTDLVYSLVRESLAHNLPRLSRYCRSSLPLSIYYVADISPATPPLLIVSSLTFPRCSELSEVRGAFKVFDEMLRWNYFDLQAFYELIC